MYYVYRIIIDGRTRYVGYTKDLDSRTKQHNYLCFGKKTKKILYNNIREKHPDIKEIKLKMVKKFLSKVEAKRYECYIILVDHFNRKELWQRVPRITDV